MNVIRRRMLHPIKSRHNPLTKAVFTLSIFAFAMAALGAVWELRGLRIVSAADKAMIAELLLVMEGKAKLVERTGEYAVEYEVRQTTYEVK